MPGGGGGIHQRAPSAVEAASVGPENRRIM